MRLAPEGREILISKIRAASRPSKTTRPPWEVAHAQGATRARTLTLQGKPGDLPPMTSTAAGDRARGAIARARSSRCAEGSAARRWLALWVFEIAAQLLVGGPISLARLFKPTVSYKRRSVLESVEY